MKNEKKVTDTNARPKPATEKEPKAKKHVSALTAAAVGRSATAQVRHHSGEGLATTGTNVSYEGATAPGGGGSAGTGYASGQEATGSGLSTSTEQDLGNAGSTTRKKKDSKTKGK